MKEVQRKHLTGDLVTCFSAHQEVVTGRVVLGTDYGTDLAQTLGTD